MSFIQTLSSYLLSKKESPKTSKNFFSWDQISKLILVVYDNQLVDIVEFIAICKKDSIAVHVAIIYEGKPEMAPKPNFEHTILDKKQFSLFGIPNQEKLTFFNNSNYDVLINLANKNQQKGLTLSKLIKSKCKIARFQHPIFDLMIDCGDKQNNHYYLQQVQVYLKMIKTNPS